MKLASERTPDDLSRCAYKQRRDLGTDSYHLTIVHLKHRNIICDCLCRRLSQFKSVTILPLSNLHFQDAFSTEVDIILACVPRDTISDPVLREWNALATRANAPLVLVSDDWPASQIITGLNGGARGFLPSSISSELAIQALRLVKAGGTFIPTSCLGHFNSAETRPPGIFTERQKQVIEAIRRGKSNKIIAHELNMSESTVKVHIRSIMKKLKATNRTQVAYLYRD